MSREEPRSPVSNPRRVPDGDPVRPAKALGDHEIAVVLAESEFGVPSKEYRNASARSLEATLREPERAALKKTAAAAAYREMMGHAEPGHSP